VLRTEGRDAGGADCGSRPTEGREGAGLACGSARGGVRDGKGAACGARGSLCGRVIGALGPVRVGAGVTLFGSAGSVGATPEDGGVRTGRRELGRRWSVGRERAVSGACCVVARPRSCGPASPRAPSLVGRRVADAVAELADPESGGDAAGLRSAVAVLEGVAAGDSLYSAWAAWRAAGVRTRTIGATASPT
jgi:hypothetical protein